MKINGYEQLFHDYIQLGKEYNNIHTLSKTIIKIENIKYDGIYGISIGENIRRCYMIECEGGEFNYIGLGKD